MWTVDQANQTVARIWKGNASHKNDSGPYP